MPARSPEELHALLAAAFNSGDLDSYAQLYEEDAIVIVPPEGEHVRGRDAILAAVAPTLALRPTFRSDVVEKLQTDGLALTHARWSALTRSSEPVEMSGSGTIVSREQKDGTWRIVLDNPMTPE
jgi:uncharacterized protein (TIGR02246 family)